MVCFSFFESRKFLPKSLELRFLTRVSASLGFYHSPPLKLNGILMALGKQGKILREVGRAEKVLTLFSSFRGVGVSGVSTIAILGVN